jgi:hypothetical protein
MTGGGSFTRGHLYCLLSNPLYVGDVAHKVVTYPGRHEAIVERETFDAVQRQLAANAASRRSSVNADAPSLLTGLVYDESGDRLCPTHANKKGQRYRYYISKRLMHPTVSGIGGWRLPARELDAVVVRAVRDFLGDELRIVEALQVDAMPPDRLRRLARSIAAAGNEWEDGSPERQRQLLSALVDRITLQSGSMRIDIKLAGLTGLHSEPDPGIASPRDVFSLTFPIQLKRRGVEAKLVMRATGTRCSPPDEKLLSLLANAHRWIEDLAQGRAASVRDLARLHGRDAGEVSRTLPLAFLSPDIVEAIVGGGQPVDLTPHRLKRIGALPFAWDQQRRRLGF